jgi:hypothetical protein
MVYNTQFGGGFNGGETAFTHLYMRNVLCACKSVGKSVGMLYLDVVTALACMLRRCIFDVSDGDELWLKSLRSHGFSDEDVEAIFNSVKARASWEIDCEGNLMEGSLGDQNVSTKITEQWYMNRWMTQEGLPGAFVTDFGCLAGTPLADLLFTVAMARIIHVMSKSLVQDDLESSIMIGEKLHFFTRGVVC